jgi:ribosomal protein RSM22 (predicted rRNA methylase)
MPATYAAVEAVFEELRVRIPDFAPRTMLDLGSGPGTAAWAACEVFPSIDRITCLERDPEWIAMGRRMAARAESDAIRNADWHAADLAARHEFDPHDLVVLSYALGEIPAEASEVERPHRHTRKAEHESGDGDKSNVGTKGSDKSGDLSYGRSVLLSGVWNATREALVIVEPGTPAGYRTMIDARRRGIDRGAHVAAPCPHDAPCPMEYTESWCHFAERLARSRRHRHAKGASLGYEDEKYSYVVLVRPGLLPPAKREATEQGTGETIRGVEVSRPATGRIVEPPSVSKGGVRLPLCTERGLVTEEIPRRDKPTYKAAKKARWGDWWE